MDYKNLLIKYLAHIADVNGDTLTYTLKEDAEKWKFYGKELPFFTVEEKKALIQCEKDAYKNYKDIYS